MITVISIIARAGIVLAWLVLGVRTLTKRNQSAAVKTLFALVLAGGVIAANHCYNIFQPINDRVTLTAQGISSAAPEEVLEEEGGDEVFLASYTVDGKDYEPGKSLKVSEGKWFWCGEAYCWRPAEDYRRPDGLTETVVIEIPAGQERQLHFQGGKWWGRVCVVLDWEVQQIDTYSDVDEIVSVDLHASGVYTLMLMLAWRVAAFSAVLSVIGAAALWLIKKEISDRTGSARRGAVLYGIIALATGIIMLAWCDKWSMWGDEMIGISIASQSFRDIVKNCLNAVDMSPPLFSTITHIWLSIMPYGHRYLYLFTIALTCGSIYLTGRIGEKLGGIRYGILAAVLIATFHATWTYTAFEMRPYPLVLFLSALALYLYMRRNEKPTVGRMLAFSFCLAALVMSHYFGYLACAGYGISDLYLRAKKRITTKTLVLSYVLPGLAGGIWLAAVYIVTLKNTASADIANFYSVPGAGELVSMLKFLTGDFEPTYLALVFGIAATAVYGGNARGRAFCWEHYMHRFLASALVGSLAAIWIYGNYINRASTMWAFRYFIFLLPYAALIVARVICVGCDTIRRVIGSDMRFISAVSLACCIVLALNGLSIVSDGKVMMKEQPYREAADWIYEQANWIFNDDTLVLGTDLKEVIDGWDKYYITRCGKRDEINVLTQRELTPEILDKTYKIFFFWGGVPVWDIWQEAIDKDFELEEEYPDINVSVYIRR